MREADSPTTTEFPRGLVLFLQDDARRRRVWLGQEHQANGQVHLGLPRHETDEQTLPKPLDLVEVSIRGSWGERGLKTWLG